MFGGQAETSSRETDILQKAGWCSLVIPNKEIGNPRTSDWYANHADKGTPNSEIKENIYGEKWRKEVFFGKMHTRLGGGRG